MSSPSRHPNLPPTHSATGERYTTFDAHLAADARPRYHAHAHSKPCQSTFTAHATFDGEGIERPWDLISSKKKKAKL
ncbi:hypothetical protein FB45DRAFT_1030888 [Roridomyces roridus]|uniref:Uncharacterized protein n=1 Tax=Roridomyces roridus TaxID=1738132 RepID=A0AAD7BLR5_9AGAR|nr:hypothetical protein FB45DRAFT_1030888 [Roridomyces roridus]